MCGSSICYIVEIIQLSYDSYEKKKQAKINTF